MVWKGAMEEEAKALLVVSVVVVLQVLEERRVTGVQVVAMGRTEARVGVGVVGRRKAGFARRLAGKGCSQVSFPGFDTNKTLKPVFSTNLEHASKSSGPISLNCHQTD